MVNISLGNRTNPKNSDLEIISNTYQKDLSNYESLRKYLVIAGAVLFTVGAYSVMKVNEAIKEARY